MQKVNELNKRILSDNVEAVMYAIRKCSVNKAFDDITIAALKKYAHGGYDDVFWEGYNLSESAKACLDILGIEKYTGLNDFTKEIIQTVFYSNDEGKRKLKLSSDTARASKEEAERVEGFLQELFSAV